MEGNQEINLTPSAEAAVVDAPVVETVTVDAPETPKVMIQSQDINFHKPVYLNDEILLEAGIDTVSEAVNIINYKLKFRRIKDGEKPELVAKGHVQIGLLLDKVE